MSFNKYYQDELGFLRESARDFAAAYPAVAQLLADRGSDPDVERLLEGVAFLTGRVRQKLDDEFPELTHGLMSLLCPHYLRPVPSMSILEFTPRPGAVRQRQRVPAGVEVISVPVDGTACSFRTCYDVDLYPFKIDRTSLETAPDGRACLRLTFRMARGATLAKSDMAKLRLYLTGESADVLYLWLCRYLAEVRLRNAAGSAEVTLEASSLRPVGFARDESLLPYPGTSFDGYRYVQEYFTLPQKFYFTELDGMGPFAAGASAETFEVAFVFSRALAPTVRIAQDDVKLYCAPIVNLLKMDSDPVRLNHEKVEYLIRPRGTKQIHYEVFSVDQAVGWVKGTAAERPYEPFYSFQHDLSERGKNTVFYQTRMRGRIVGDGTDIYSSFVNDAQETVIPPTETVVFRLTCTNGALPNKLKVGDIRVASNTSPEFAEFRNITSPTPTIRPPIEGDLYWRLISHLSLNHLSLMDVQALRGILDLYNLQSVYDQQASRANDRRLQGIREIRGEGADLLFHGAPIRGTRIHLSLQEDHFASEGDMFVFASVLDEFFSLYASINSFSQLTVKGVQRGEIYTWPPRLGRQIVA